MPTALLALAALSLAAPPEAARIRSRAGPSDISVTVTRRTAGAIDSITWGGMEFVDSADHGRQVQSASSFDAGLPGEFWAERYNPTEAGSRLDGAGPHSTSQLLFAKLTPSEMLSVTRMAFWLAPGEKSSGRPAINREAISDHVLTKIVTLNAEGHPHAIRHQVTFTVPPGERNTFAQFEALTGYMPAAFSVFETFDPRTGQLAPLADGPGEQRLPLVFSTPDGHHAMGCYSREPGVSYGRWRFPPQRVVKWNAVLRERGNPVPAGPRVFTVFTAVGSRQNVRDTLALLAAKR